MRWRSKGTVWHSSGISRNRVGHIFQVSCRDYLAKITLRKRELCWYRMTYAWDGCYSLGKKKTSASKKEYICQILKAEERWFCSYGPRLAWDTSPVLPEAEVMAVCIYLTILWPTEGSDTMAEFPTGNNTLDISGTALSKWKEAHILGNSFLIQRRGCPVCSHECVFCRVTKDKAIIL